jgi:(p)ppGpp synthase/HD superfamily hydrolase
MDMEIIDRAMEYALKAHKGQFRKGTGLPYFVHPISVLAQIGDWEVKNEVIWASALLHDVREESDGKITQKNIAHHFGAEIANVVEELTFLPPEGIPTKERVQLKKNYMKSFNSKSLSALVVKIADRCVNTCDFYCTSQDYAPKYWKKAEALFEAMSNRREEITKAFGGEELGVFPRIKYTHTTLCQMVA